MFFNRKKDLYQNEDYRKKRNFRWVSVTFISLLSLLFIILLSAFIFRQNILEYIIEKAKAKAEQYHSKLFIEKASITGIADVELTKISLVPDQSDTLIVIDKLYTGVRIWKLLTGDIMLSHLTLDHGRLHLVKYDSLKSNYQNFTKKEKKSESTESNKMSLARRTYNLIKNVLGQIPGSIKIGTLETVFTQKNEDYSVTAENLTLEDDQIKCYINIKTPENNQFLKVSGMFSPDNLVGDIHIQSKDLEWMYLPLAQEKFGLVLGAKDIHLKLDEVDYENGELSIKTFAEMKDIVVNHPRLALNDVKVRVGSGDLHFRLGENFVMIDSSSTFKLNKINIHPYARFQNKPVIEYDLKLVTDRMSSNDFFNSLPDGMFESLSGIEAEGFLTYRMDGHLSDTAPYNCTFNSEMIPENFRIKRYGKAYLPKLNGEFTYIPSDYSYQRKINVSPDNSNYVTLDEISDVLKKTVLTTEDPAFYNHRGFIIESIRQSIAQNYVYKRFVRGGSTITMQLVKNVFLTRNKTLSRKFEEMLLVWMIENMGITSKARMYEVYMNIIEWGPGIYGVGEATQFYFDKSPSQINLQEAIFMASLIPHPKWFASSFNDSNQMLKKHFKGYYHSISNLMVNRKLIDPEDTTGLEPNVILRGPAKNMLRKKVVVLDSTDIDEQIPVLDGDLYKDY